MSSTDGHRRTKAQVLAENEQLRLRLEEAEQTLEAIRHGDVDALVVLGPPGEQIYTLTGAEHVYRVIVETMNEAALMVDPDGTILFSNQRFCDLMRTSMQSIVGHGVTTFVARPQQLPLNVLLKDAQAGPVQRRLTLQAADGTVVPVQLAASLLRSEENKSICLVVTDLTELEASANSIHVLREHQQALEESEARFRTIFESSQDAIVIVNDEGVCVQANPVAWTIFGVPPGQLIGRSITDFAYDAVDFPVIWQTFLVAGSFRGELRLIGANGQVRDVDTYLVANILPGRHMSVIRDITERKRAQEALQGVNAQLQIQAEELEVQAEELRVQTDELANANTALRESEETYRTLFNSIDQGFCIVEIVFDAAGQPADYRFLETNPAFERQTGLHEAEGKLMRELAPDHEAHWFEMYGRVALTGAPARFVNEAKALGRWYDVYAFRVDEPQSRHVAILFNDITERKRSEEALRESEERYHHLFEDDLTGDFISTPEGEILLCNPAFAKIFGFSSAVEAVGTNLLDFYLDASEREPLVQRLKQQGKIERQEAWRTCRDGKPIYVVENLVGHFNEEGELYEIKGYLFDDTERKQAEAALRESEERFRTLADNMSQFAWMTDATGWIFWYNQRWYEYTGTTFEEMQGWGWQKVHHPEYVEQVTQKFRDHLQTGEAWEDTFPLRGRDGNYRWFLSRAIPIRDEQGKVVRWFGTNTDITEQRNAEQALRETRDYLDNLFSYANAPIIVWDPQFTITRFNHAFARLTGREAQEVLGRDIGILFPADSRAESLAHIRRTTSEGQRWEVIEIPILHKDQSVRTVLWNSANVLGPDNKTIIATIAQGQDITERKQAEEALRDLTGTLETKVAQRTAELEHRARQLQKLALEVSQAEDRERKHLAEILHDDLQQQLAAAKFHLGMLTNRVKYDPVPRSIAGQVDHMLADAIEKSRSLSHELSPAILYHGNLGEALEWLAGQVQTKYGLTVHVDADGEVDVRSDALKVFLFRAAQELLFNVVKHARVNAARVRVRCMGHCLCLCVSDRGRGFDPQDLKATAGFGLLSIRERVELLGGRMRIRAAAGKGSTFFLAVPDGELSGADLEREHHSGEEASGRAGGDQTVPEPSRRRLRVLLADDHEIVREGLAILLNDQPDIEIVGQAANGREAVDLAYQLHPDVVVMDVAMPLMGGDEATRQIKLHMPNVRVIGLSMYEEDNMAEKMRRAGAEAYLLKTGPAEELLAVIRGEVVTSK